MPAAHALLFGADSIIFSNSEFSIDDISKYVFIAVPLTTENPDYDRIVVVRGTLSLRSGNAMVNVARKTDVSIKFLFII
jgi:hypothetical protein